MPGAKKTIDVVVFDWIKAQTLMFSRLRRDRRKSALIIAGEASRRVRHIRPGLSDPHAGGQTVTILQFTDGSRTIYKPRSCEGEEIWFAALRWCNENGFEPPFRIPEVIAQRNYGWMSFVDHRGCRSKKAIRRFYFRWGAQTAIAQLLGCADLHRQNWIASGENPVLVDAEMLGDGFANNGCRTGAMSRLHPLLRTGLLPILEIDGVGRYKAIAPFDSRADKRERKLFWPTYRGKVERPASYIKQIADGYIAASRFVCDPLNRNTFELFIKMAAQRTKLRVLKRATVRYHQILSESLQPRYLELGGDRLNYLHSQCGPTRIGKAEARCLERCSIPRFIKSMPGSKTRKRVPALDLMLDSTKFLRSRL